MRLTKFLMVGWIIGFFTIHSCTSDNLPEPTTLGCESGTVTYSNTIQAILETNCAYTGCHLSGFPNGNLSSYGDDLISFLENGDFKERAIDLRDMPPYYAFGPTTLTDEEMQSLRCWIEDGFPQ